MDDWGAFTSIGKKKKGKKGAEPEIPPPPPAPEPMDLGASGTADGGEDDWTGFSTGKKKKTAKKGKVRVTLLNSIGVCAIWTTTTCTTKHIVARGCRFDITTFCKRIARHIIPCFAVAHSNNLLHESRAYPHTAAAKGVLSCGVRRSDLRNLTQLACSDQHIDTR